MGIGNIKNNIIYLKGSLFLPDVKMSEYPSTSQEYPTSVEFQSTKRGRRMLCRAGYSYVWKRTNKDGTDLWRCTKKSSSKCNATLKVITHPTPFTILNETAHNHEPKGLAEIEIEKQMRLCEEALQNNIDEPVQKIFTENMKVLTDKGINLLTSLPQFDNVKKRLYKQRKLSVGERQLKTAMEPQTQI